MAYEDIAADVTIDNDTNVIDYVGTAHGVAAAGYYTGIYFHRWLGSLADDQEASDVSGDYMDMTKLTPSSRNGIDQIIEMLNGYTITQTMAEHLYDCSIIQAGGADIWDAITVIAGEGCDTQIIQDGAIISNDFWNSIPSGETLKGLNRDVANGVSSRFLLKVRTAGADIDFRRIIGQTRVWGYTYSEFKVNGTGRGNNVIALNYSVDNNNQTLKATVDGWAADFSNTEGYRAIDINFDSTDEFYFSEWDINKANRSINDAYEYWKAITSQGEVGTALTYGLTAELFRGITHEIPIGNGVPAGTWVEPEAISWPGGTGQLLAIDNVASASATTIWMQVLTGVAPAAADITITGAGGATSDTSSAAIEKPLSQPFCGSSTGSALLGSYGFGIVAADVTNNERLVALDGVTYFPPNNQSFFVNGVVSAEDYILTGLRNVGDTDIEQGQFALNTPLVAATGTEVVVKVGVETPGTGTDSATDTPSSGTIRILGDDGIYHRVDYSAYTVQASTMTFTVTTAQIPTASVDNDVYISYIDKLATSTAESYLATFSANRNLFVRVRDGKLTPIKTFEGKGAFTSAGGTVNVSRVSDE